MAEEFLICARWVVPVEPAGAALENHAVAVRAGRIEALLPAAAAAARFPGYRTVALPHHALMPGLVNAHTHAATALLRGLSQAPPADATLRILPPNEKRLSAEFVRDGTLLACAEMLRGGITCFNDMYFFPEAALEAALQAGMRSAQGVLVTEHASAYASDPADYLRKGLALRDRCRDEPLASFCLAPHAMHAISDDVLRQVATLAAELDIPVHACLHESAIEIERAVAARGVRPIERLHRLGLLGPNLVAVHCIQLEPGEAELLSRHGCSVVRCPTSSLRLAGALAPLASLLAANLNLAIGTDGATANPRLDMFQEMRSTALPAQAALHAATLGGARALGIDRITGSIVPGKAADLVALDFGSPGLAPCYDPVFHLAHAAGRENVSHVWVAGRLLLQGGMLQNALFSSLDTRTQMWQNALASAGS